MYLIMVCVNRNEFGQDIPVRQLSFAAKGLLRSALFCNVEASVTNHDFINGHAGQHIHGRKRLASERQCKE